MGTFSIWHWLIVFLYVFLIWLLPIILSARMARNRKRSVALWTIFAIPFGWIVVLALAVIGTEQRPAEDKYAKIEKAKKLMDEGALTPEEYEVEKAKMLDNK